MTDCPCGSTQKYDICCAPFLKGEGVAPTAEALMRSRYTAFVKQEIDYLKETTWPSLQKDFNHAACLERAQLSLWLGLTIEDHEAGSESDSRGTVTFVAKSMIQGHVDHQREKSLFKKKKNRWYYVKALEG